MRIPSTRTAKTPSNVRSSPNVGEGAGGNSAAEPDLKQPADNSSTGLRLLGQDGRPLSSAHAETANALIGAGSEGSTTARNPRQIHKAFSNRIESGPPLERPEVKFKALDWPTLDADGVLKVAAGILAEQNASYLLSTFNRVEAFISRRLENPEMDCLDPALHAFDSRAEFRAGTGGNCIGLGQDLVKQLHERGLPAALAPMQRLGTVAHGSVLVPFQDQGGRAIVLLEPGFNIGRPLLVRPGKPAEAQSWTRRGERTWRFTLDMASNELGVEPTGVDRSVVPLVAWLNPDESFQSGRVVSANTADLIARNARGDVTAALILSMEGHEELGLKPWDLRIVRRNAEGIDYTHSLNSREALAEHINDEFAAQFGVSQSALIGRVWHIYDHRALIQEAKKSWRKHREV